MAYYYGIDTASNELYHYGVRGMKWGVRKQRPVGNGMRKRSSWAQASQMARSANAQRRQAWKRSNVKNLSAHEQRIRRRTKVARGALIVAGSAAMLGAGYLAATRTKTGRRMIAKGSDYLLKGKQSLWRNVQYPAKNKLARAKGKYQIRKNALTKAKNAYKKTVKTQTKYYLPKSNTPYYHPAYDRLKQLP